MQVTVLHRCSNRLLQQHAPSHMPNETEKEVLQQRTASLLVPSAFTDMTISLELASKLQLPGWCMTLLRERNLDIAAALLQNSVAAWGLVHVVRLPTAAERSASDKHGLLMTLVVQKSMELLMRVDQICQTDSPSASAYACLDLMAYSNSAIIQTIPLLCLETLQDVTNSVEPHNATFSRSTVFAAHSECMVSVRPFRYLEQYPSLCVRPRGCRMA